MTIETFCKIVWNLPYNQVNNCIDKSEYTQFSIPKKNGSRTITHLPEESSLYWLQKNLQKNYLHKQELPVCVKGFIEGENYISYLEPHVGANYFLRIDIKEFFPSITREKIKETFSKLIPFDSDDDKSKILDLISEICTYKNDLPQGVPSSPTISNIVMAQIDQRITKYCQILRITYTRYADDMFFSSKEFDFKTKKWFIKKIKFILSSKSFKINYSKLKYGEREISLSGYVVSNEGIRLSRGRLTDIRKAIAFSRNHHSIAKTNPDNFLNLANNIPLVHRNLRVYPFTSLFQFTQFLAGYRSYLISFLRYDIEKSFKKRTIKLIQSIEKQLDLY